MFEQTFKNIDDVLWKEAGCTTELDYTEQTSWMLFLNSAFFFSTLPPAISSPPHSPNTTWHNLTTKRVPALDFTSGR